MPGNSNLLEGGKEYINSQAINFGLFLSNVSDVVRLVKNRWIPDDVNPNTLELVDLILLVICIVCQVSELPF